MEPAGDVVVHSAAKMALEYNRMSMHRAGLSTIARLAWNRRQPAAKKPVAPAGREAVILTTSRR